jgi:predicted transcriptional regulator
METREELEKQLEYQSGQIKQYLIHLNNTAKFKDPTKRLEVGEGAVGEIEFSLKEIKNIFTKIKNIKQSALDDEWDKQHKKACDMAQNVVNRISNL